jgi:hypothetical protein
MPLHKLSLLSKWHRGCLVDDHGALWIVAVDRQCVVPIRRRCDLPVNEARCRRSNVAFCSALAS